MQKQKMEFSKKILIVVGIVSLAIIVFSCVMMLRTGDLSPLQVLIPSMFAEVATGTGFYYWKAKMENQIKLKQAYGVSEPDNGFADGEQF